MFSGGVISTVTAAARQRPYLNLESRINNASEVLNN
jgi:hypothetical protein